MKSDQHLMYRCGDLSIDPQLGTVTNNSGQAARLGPVNMKVLALLLSRPKTVVSRSELFDSIWKNQVVSDDALTRCISDIRAQLKRLSSEQNFIETIPKRGYRWTVYVEPMAPPSEHSADSFTPIRKIDESTSLKQISLLEWLRRAILYCITFVLIASASVWTLDKLNQPDLPVIAVLPIQSNSPSSRLAIEVEQALTQHLLSTKTIRVLSQSAIATRPANPFPYFYYEFGARWITEIELRESSTQTRFQLTVVDARSGIVLFQATEILSLPSDSVIDLKQSTVIQSLNEFIEAAL